MLVKSLKSANERSRVLQDDSNSIVDMLQHLVVLADRLKIVNKKIIYKKNMYTLYFNDFMYIKNN